MIPYSTETYLVAYCKPNGDPMFEFLDIDIPDRRQPTIAAKLGSVGHFTEQIKAMPEDVEIFAIRDYQFMTSLGLFLIVTGLELKKMKGAVITDAQLMKIITTT